MAQLSEFIGKVQRLGDRDGADRVRVGELLNFPADAPLSTALFNRIVNENYVFVARGCDGVVVGVLVYAVVSRFRQVDCIITDVAVDLTVDPPLLDVAQAMFQMALKSMPEATVDVIWMSEFGQWRSAFKALGFEAIGSIQRLRLL